MIDFNYKSNVVLPEWIWEEAKDTEQLKKLVLQYAKTHYPDYKVKSIKNGMAVCVRQ